MSDQSDRWQPGEREQERVLAEAMGDPLRGRLLLAVSEKSDEGVSIRQLAERLGESKRRVRYHLDALVDLGLVSVASVRTRSGVVERFYNMEQTPIVEKELLDRELARKVSTEGLKMILADASGSMGAGLFGVRPGHTIIRVTGRVDERGWEELAALQLRAFDEAEAVIKKARRRLPDSGEPQISTIAALLLFEVPPWPSP